MCSKLKFNLTFSPNLQILFGNDINTSDLNDTSYYEAEKLVSRCDASIVDKTINIYKPTISSVYKDLTIPDNIWHILTEYTLGSGLFRVITHYNQWTLNERTHTLYVIPFTLGYIQYLTWFIFLFTTSYVHALILLSILVIVSLIHLTGIIISWSKAHKIVKILKQFCDYLQRNARQILEHRPKDNINNNDRDVVDIYEPLQDFIENFEKTNNFEATIAFQRWNNIFRLHPGIEFSVFLCSVLSILFDLIVVFFNLLC